MLGADAFAGAALQAILCLGAFPGVDVVIVISGVPVVEDPLGIQQGEEAGDVDTLGADLSAVPAAGAGNGAQVPEDLTDFCHRFRFLFIQGLEVGHIAQVVFHHCHIAHTGQGHNHALLGCGETDGIAGVGAALQIVKHLLSRLGQLNQAAALDGFHNNGALAVLAADFQALPGLHRRIVEVHIVQLDLHHLDLGIFGEDLVQNWGFIVEGDAKVLDFTFCEQFQRSLVTTQGFVPPEAVGILGMHQVEVKILHTAGFQLLLEQGTDILVFLDEVAGEFIDQDVLVPGIAGGQAFFQRKFALAAQIAVGGIKIVEACRQEGIHHFVGFFNVHLAVYHRQTHTAEAEVLFNFGKISCHKGYLLQFSFIITCGSYYRSSTFLLQISSKQNSFSIDIYNLPRYTYIVQKRTICERLVAMRFASGINYFDTAASAQKYYTKLLDSLCKEWNLTHNELDILLFLHNNPEYDRATDIVSHRGIAKSHVSLGVTNLVEKAFLMRRFDESDRRTAHLTLTEQGKLIASQGREVQQQYFAAMYQGISPEELEIWKKIVLKVQNNVRNFEEIL